MDPIPGPLERFEEMAAISGRMLEAAHCGDWDRMVDEERHCRALVELLRSQGEIPLTGAQRRRKYTIIRKILSDDADIRRLAAPWLHNLENILSASGNARRLNESYGSQP